jgi:PAS domain S-box-containing protein
MSNNEIYKFIFEEFNDALFIIELAPLGKILEVNTAACKNLGYNKKELVGCTIDTIDKGATEITNSGSINQFQQNKKSIRETVHIRKDGTEFPVELSGNIIKYNNKDAVLTMVRDISKRKKNEQRIIEQSEYNALRADVWELASDKSFSEKELITKVLNLVGPVLNVSRACYNILEDKNQYCSLEWCEEGVKPSIGSKMPNFILKHLMDEKIIELTPEQALERLPKNIRTIAKPVLKGLQKSLDLDTVTFIPYYIGGKIEGSISIDVCKKKKNKPSWTKERKELIHELVRVIAQTIEQKRIEKALEKSEEKYRELGELLPQTIFEIDLKGNFLYANQFGLNFFGYTQKELQKGINISDLLNNDLHAKAVNNIKKIVEKGIIDSAEYMMKKKNSSVFPGLVISRPIIQDNEPTGLRGIVVDLTNQKKTEKEYFEAKNKAEESDQLKSAFLANMSHEIRTPLNAILGMSDLLKEEDISNEEKHQYTKIIRDRGTDLLHLINDIIDISKIEANQVSIDPEPCSVNSIIYELYTHYNAEKEKNDQSHIQLMTSLSFDDADSFIIADPTRLKQVLSNLLSNALKYTDKGTINIGYKQKKDKIEFFVNDTGIGIPKNKLNTIFERFRQLDDNDTRPISGTGLGLSISRKLAELMDGKLSVSSTPGKGSVFTFSMPYKPAKYNSVITKDLSFTDDRKIWNDKKILIVEDDNFSFQYLEALLRPTNVQIIHATDGQSAIDICKKQDDINLVLMDIQLPEKDGLTTTREIKKLRTNLHIIAQTAYAMEEDRARSFKAGCSDYISKPIDKRTLIAIINKYI